MSCLAILILLVSASVSTAAPITNGNLASGIAGTRGVNDESPDGVGIVEKKEIKIAREFQVP